MRAIKFRCWNGEQMVSPDYISRAGIAFWKENSIPQSNEEIMQFTGLLDKNGKEIYEGDLIGNYATGYAEVVFDNGAFRVNGSFLTRGYLSMYGTGVEIGGNIYENEKLLTNQ